MTSLNRTAQVLHPNRHHDLHYTEPAPTWDEGFPLGNALLGALIWGDGAPLNISLDRADLWDLREVPEFHSEDYNYETVRRWHAEGRHADLERLLESPYNRPAPTKLPAGRLCLELGQGFDSGHLSLEQALARVSFIEGAEIEVFVHACESVGWIRLTGAPQARLHLIPPAFSGRVDHAAQGGITAGDLAQLGYPAALETSGSAWQSFTQPGEGGFSFAAHLGWKVVEEGLEAVWSVASSAEGNPGEIARARVEAALEQGFAAALSEHRGWWAGFWSKSSLSLPDPVLERLWYLEQYKFGAVARRGAPPITLQAVWTADDGGLPPWKGDYHHDLNTQLSYWPCYAGNHLEEGLGFLDWLWDTRSNCREWTQRFFGLPGLNVPMTADLMNRQLGGWRQYTHSATTGAWLAHHFYLHWRFSADKAFLEQRAYPYLREVAEFLEAISRERDLEGKRTLALSSSPEIHDNRPEAWFASLTNYDLALMRWLFGASAELAEELGQLGDGVRWRGVLSELPELVCDAAGGLLVAENEPLGESHRHFSHLMALHPLGLVSPHSGAAQHNIFETSLAQLEALGTSLWCGYSFAWRAALAAWVGDGAGAARFLDIFSRAFTLRNSFHCNGDQSGQGYSNWTYRPFTLEGNFAAAHALQEMLLQSHEGVIRIFPAVPEHWETLEFHGLRAQGALLVSARKDAGKVTFLEVVAEQAGKFVLMLPGHDAALSFTLEASEKRTLIG